MSQYTHPGGFKRSGDISETSKVKVYCLGSSIFINLILSQMPVRCTVRKCSFSRSESLKLFIVFCNQRWHKPGVVCISLIITWIWASLGRWWKTGKPGLLQSMGSQKIGHDLATEQQSLYGFLWYHLARSHKEGQEGDLWYLLNKEAYL